MKTILGNRSSLFPAILVMALNLVSTTFLQGQGILESATKIWVTESVRESGVYYRTFYSQTVQTEVSYHVYLPPDYNEHVNEHYPVLYWLHGWGKGTKGISKITLIFNGAIESGKIPPMIIVFPNGDMSMWCNWKDGTRPLETVIMEELIPDVDRHFKTIPTREGRLIEGFSMGGYGAARLGFKYPEVFGSISILSGGPLQRELTFTPRANDRTRKRILQQVYGGDMEYFIAQSPWQLVEENAGHLQTEVLIRQVIGDQDEMLEATRNFNAHLGELHIPNTYTELPGVGHDPLKVFNTFGEDNWAFYRKAFSLATNKKGTTIFQRFK